MSLKSSRTPSNEFASLRPVLPPSPPLSPALSAVVAQIVARIRTREQGRIISDGSPWEEFRVSLKDLDLLETELRSQRLWGFYKNEIRSDFDPARSIFTLRMPTPLHCYFADSVIQAVLERIATLAKDLAEQHPEASQWLKLLRSGANEDIDLASDNDDDKSTKRSPDGTLGHRKAEYPPAVFEISYSQKRKQLPSLAHSYIIDSCHGIKCVVGLDIEYERPGTTRDTSGMMRKEASLSVWRARLMINEDTGEEEADCEAEVMNDVFRRQDGSAGTGSLCLTMQDLLPKALLSSGEDLSRYTITISYEDLTSLLIEAEDIYEMRKEQAHYRKETKLRRKKRERTPEEELSDGRESKYAKAEIQAEEMVHGLDGAYEPATRLRALPARRRSERLSSRQAGPSERDEHG